MNFYFMSSGKNVPAVKDHTTVAVDNERIAVEPSSTRNDTPDLPETTAFDLGRKDFQHQPRGRHLHRAASPDILYNISSEEEEMTYSARRRGRSRSPRRLYSSPTWEGDRYLREVRSVRRTCMN